MDLRLIGRVLAAAFLAFPALQAAAQLKTVPIEAGASLGQAGASAVGTQGLGAAALPMHPPPGSLALPSPNQGLALPLEPGEPEIANGPSAVVAAPLGVKGVSPAAQPENPDPDAVIASQDEGGGSRGGETLDADVESGRVRFDQAGVRTAQPETVEVPSDAPRLRKLALGSRRLVPDGSAGQVLRRALKESPEAAAAFGARLEASSYGPGLEGDWSDELGRALAFRLALRSGGMDSGSLDSYLEMAGGSSEQARAERRALAEFLRDSRSGRGEAWTYIFRDYPLWREPLDRFLDDLIQERRGSRDLLIHSVGAGFGSEGYGLAIVVEQALRRAGQDPAAWNVKIAAYDVSFPSLLSAGRGLYRPSPRDESTFKELGLAAYFEAGPGDLLRLKEPLRRWIRPVYADLNDEAQHPVVTGQSPDIVFANYLLVNLRLQPASALADHWLSGTWSRRGFLSMAKTVVAEVGASPRVPAPIGARGGVFGAFAGYIGFAGQGFYGDSNRIFGFIADLRDAWRARRHPGVRSALKAGRGLGRVLRLDPFAVLEADPAAVDFLVELGRTQEMILTDQEGLTFRIDEKSRRLYVNLGWALAGSDLAALKGLVGEEIAKRGPAALAGRARAPPIVDHPTLGTGQLILTGRTIGGAVIKFGRFGDRTAAWWLTPRLVPITDDFKGDNAAKSAEQLEREYDSIPHLHGGGFTIRY